MEARELCLVLRPSVKEFSRPFCDYIKDVLQGHPEVPMFKVVPPEGWEPSSLDKNKINTCLIETPIKQNVRPS